MTMFIIASSTTSSNENDSGIAAALGALLVIAVIGFVISLVVNVLLFTQRKKARLFYILNCYICVGCLQKTIMFEDTVFA